MVRQPGSLGIYLVPLMLAGSSVPLAVYDWDDSPLIPRKNWALLERATFFFRTHLIRNPYKSFLFQDKRNDCLFNIVRQPRLIDWAHKLRPYGIGITLPNN